MASSIAWRDRSFGYDDAYSSNGPRTHRKFAGAAFLCIAFACAWTLWTNLAGSGEGGVADVASSPAPATSPARAPATALNAVARRTLVAAGYSKLAEAFNSYGTHFDARYLGFAPGKFAKGSALIADGRPASDRSGIEGTQSAAATRSGGKPAAPGDAATGPAPRAPQIRTASLRDALHGSRAGVDERAERPSIFQRLFGKPSPVALAYAAPEDGGLSGQGVPAGRYDRSTAVYDISAHVVYLPDGTRLEAHSGFGPRLDDPRYADEKMRGVTPPNVYDLEMREGLFHGVRALRLIPLDEAKVLGRTGLLAHTFMLGPNGQSNGCVSFRDYDAFLRAYLSGEIKRLAVVARLD
jgi:hypothetical protein